MNFFKKETNEVLLYNALANTLSFTQYLLLGAYTGSFCCAIAVTRNIIFSKFKDNVPIMYLLIYIVLVVGINISFIHSIVDIIPVINIILFAFALWTKQIRLIKIAGLFTCVDGIFYDFIKKAYTSIFTEIVDGVVGVLSLKAIYKDTKK